MVCVCVQVEDIIRERAEEVDPGDEYMFFDPADDLDETLLGLEDTEISLSSNGACATLTPSHTPAVGAEIPLISELHAACRTDKGDPLRGVHILGVTLLER